MLQRFSDRLAQHHSDQSVIGHATSVHALGPPAVADREAAVFVSVAAGVGLAVVFN